MEEPSALMHLILITDAKSVAFHCRKLCAVNCGRELNKGQRLWHVHKRTTVIG